MTEAQLHILLVRHAEPASFERAEGAVHRDGPRSAWNERPLSERGLHHARELGARLAIEKPVAIYSSPYRRARQTVEPLAAMVGLPIVTIDDLRERLLSLHLTDDFREHMRRAWQDLDFALDGAESGRQAQTRIVRVLEQVRANHRSGVAVMASHGNLIALALNFIAPQVDHDFWDAMPMPAVYRLRFADGRWDAEGPGLR